MLLLHTEQFQGLGRQVKYPLMTIKIIGSIHFEAFLLWKKGAIYRKRNTKITNNLSYEEY